MRTLCLCLSLLNASVGLAADEFTKVSCRFLYFDVISQAPPAVVNLSDKGTELVCPMPTNGLSEPIECFAKGNVIAFLDAADRKPAAAATIPPNSKNVILMFVPVTADAPKSLPWRVLVINDTPENFPDGGAFIANFHKQDIRMVLGENRTTLRAGACQGLQRPVQRDAFNMAPVVCQFQQDNDWRTASETLLRFVNGSRYLMVAYLDPASGQPQVATYQVCRPIAVPPAPPRSARPK